MRLSAYASRVVYERHLDPILTALRLRGIEVEAWSPRSGSTWALWSEGMGMGDLVLVASYADARRWKDRHVVYVEHGAGQTYHVPRGTSVVGFPGSDGLDNVALFLTPSERVSECWRA